MLRVFIARVLPSARKMSNAATKTSTIVTPLSLESAGLQDFMSIMEISILRSAHVGRIFNPPSLACGNRSRFGGSSPFGDGLQIRPTFCCLCPPAMNASPRPSLFDLQVNGFAGVDFQREDLTLDGLRRAVHALRAHETHRIFLTLITDAVDALCRKFAHIETLHRTDPLAAETICGYHLEGPWLSPEPGYCGAHPPEHMHAPSLADYRRLQDAAGGNIRLITIAPEWPGSDEFIAAVVRENVVVSLGHTDAGEAQIDAAIRAGAALVTHLGNGVPQTLHRHDNVIHRLLARDELIACLIPDGVHLPPFALRNLFRAKLPGRAIFT